MIDTTELGSPGWWLSRLMEQLTTQSERADELDEAVRNERAIPIAASKGMRDAYRRLMAMARTNFAELIVEAVRERMVIAGFRTGATADPTGDEVAWRLWQANALDADADHVHRAQLAMASAYVIVGRDGDDVLITPEDPRQVVAELDPVRRRVVRAALKVFPDDVFDVDRAHLFLPGLVFKAKRRSTVEGPPPLNGEGWEWEDGTPETLPKGMLPVVPFLNRPNLFSVPQGEFESHLSLLDRINYGVLNRLEVATLQAFRQRALKGVPSRDEHGQEIDYSDVFAADPGALWLMPETAELWESGQVDLGPIRMASSDDVEHLAAVSRTPMHYFAPGGANQSAEGASLAREALVFKVRDRLKQTGESWEQVMSLAFTFAGDDQRARRSDLEVIWQDPERYSLSERADAATKAQAGGLPWRTVMERIWQLTPQEIARADAERFTDALNAALGGVEPWPSPPSPEGDEAATGAEWEGDGG